MGHTPGPWQVSSGSNEPRQRKVGTGECGWLGLAFIFGDTEEEAEANAQIMAASPDLLDACEWALRLFGTENEQGNADFKRILEAAINKATGKQKATS